MRWFLILLVLIVSCNGEVERVNEIKKPTLSIITDVYAENEILIPDFPIVPEQKNDDLKKELEDTKETIARLMVDVQELKKIKVRREPRKVPIEILLKDKAFKLTGHYGHGTKCRGKIYRKDFTESRMYYHVDCNGNYVTQQVLRRK